MLEWKYQESVERPKAVDTESSKTKVYFAKDIKEIEKEDSNGNKYKLFAYQGAVISREQYQIAEAATALLQEDMEEVKTRQQATSEDMTVLQEALSDIYTQISSNT